MLCLLTRQIGRLSRPFVLQAFWALAAAALILCSVWQHSIAADSHPQARMFVISQLVAGFIFLVAVYAALRRPASVSLTFVLAVGISCRLILLSSTPLFDDHIYRSLWDGRLLSHGINPYLYRPDAEELAHLRDSDWARIDDPDLPTPHPPLAQLIFGLGYVAGLRNPLGLKSLFFLFDAANTLLIATLLRRLRLPASWALIYAWSPLAAKEFANSGRIEPVMLFFLLLAFFFWLKPEPDRGWAGVALGASAAVNFVPALLAPIAWKLGRWRSILYAVGALVLLYLPFAGAGRNVFASPGAYAQHGAFNDSVFALLRKLQSLALPDTSMLPVSPIRLISALAIGTFAVWTAIRLKDNGRVGALTGSRNVIAVCLMLMPAVYPWRVCWLLPFLCIAPSVGLLLFTVTCSLSYLYYSDTSLAAWIPLIEYVPVYLILLAEFLPTKPKRFSAAAHFAHGDQTRN